jgi:hypothetical protein
MFQVMVFVPALIGTVGQFNAASQGVAPPCQVSLSKPQTFVVFFITWRPCAWLNTLIKE